MNTEDLQKQFNKEFTEQAIILDKYMSKCHELEQKLSACETVLEDTQKQLQHIHNKIMVQWEKDFGSIHNEQTMDAYTVSGFIRQILGTDKQT